MLGCFCEGESAVTETELYRRFDVATSVYHSSLMIVGGRAAGGPPEDEFTILVRGR